MKVFDRDEYDARVKRVQAQMNANGFDLLLSCDPANMNYLTGYDGWSFYTPQLVAVPANGDEPICIVRGIDQPGGVVTCYLREENILGYPDDYVQSTDKHPMEWMAEVFISRGLDTGTIAVDMDAYYYSARAHAALVAALPNAAFVDSGKLVNWARLIKSDAEIRYMREAGKLIELAMQAGIDAIEPGIRQCDAVADIYNAQIRGTPEFGGEYTSLVPMLPTGEGTTTPHLTWNSEPFKEGEPTILELAGCRNRYHCPMSRTVHLAPPRTHGNRCGGRGRGPQHCHRYHETRCDVRAGARRVECCCPASWDRERFPDGIFHRTELSTRLGRAHPFDPYGRHDRVAAGHDASCHARNLARQLGD
jgi:ectoine hydrolase